MVTTDSLMCCEECVCVCVCVWYQQHLICETTHCWLNVCVCVCDLMWLSVCMCVCDNTFMHSFIHVCVWLILHEGPDEKWTNTPSWALTHTHTHTHTHRVTRTAEHTHTHTHQSNTQRENTHTHTHTQPEVCHSVYECVSVFYTAAAAASMMWFYISVLTSLINSVAQNAHLKSYQLQSIFFMS